MDDRALPQLEAAVLAGAASIADYQSRAFALGFGQADVDAFVAVLHDELDVAAATDQAHAAIAAQLGAGDASLAQLEATVRNGSLSVDDYVAALEQQQVDAVDAELLAARLRAHLEAAGGAA